MTGLEIGAAHWLNGFYELEHLLATRRWVLALRPHASAELLLAAQVHDAERFFPGGPPSAPRGSFDHPEYLFAHSLRSGDVVESWLRDLGSPPDDDFIHAVRCLVLRHEVGGGSEADVLQAADSLSFLETLSWLTVEWVQTGRYTSQQAKQKLRWMLERIRLPEAVALALPHYESAVRALEAADGRFDTGAARASASNAEFLLGTAGNRHESRGA